MKITVFGKDIPLYGICFFFGVVAAVVVAVLLIKKRKIAFFDFVCVAAYALIGAILGAKLLFLLVSWQEILELQLSFLEIMRGGFVFYGGLLGGALGIFIYGKQFKADIRDHLDVCAVVVPLGHGFGRIGCFCAGCCYGVEYHGFGSFTYTEPTNAHTPVGVPLLPVQLIEAFFLFVLFAVLLFLFFKKEKRGIPAAVYLAGYAVLRFVLEFFRGDSERGLLLGLSTSQWISILILCVVAAFVFLRVRRTRAEKK